MNVVNFINNAREKGMNDSSILIELKDEAPHKKKAINEALSKGISSTQILDEILEQNAVSQEESSFTPLEVEKEAPTPKRTENAKLWTRIFITLILVCATSMSFTILYRSFSIPHIRSIYPEVIIKEVSYVRPHSPLITLNPETDNIKRVAISSKEEYLTQLRELMRSNIEEDLVRVITEDYRTKEGQILTLDSFFSVFDIKTPPTFFDNIERKFDLYIYTGERTNKLGFIAEFDKNKYETVKWMIMRPWEETIEKDFSYLFEYFGEKIPETREELTIVDYRIDQRNSVNIHYREGEKDAGLYYAITGDSIIFATSMGTIQTIINRR